MYNDPNCKPWTSGLWAPVGYTSRYDLVEQTKAAQARKPFADHVVEEKQFEHAAVGGEGVDMSNSKEQQPPVPFGANKDTDANGRDLVHDVSDDVDRSQTYLEAPPALDMPDKE